MLAASEDRERDRQMMWRALALARQGLGLTRPNPAVGAVVTDAEGLVAGDGWHERAGGPHAEIVALEAAGERARGGTLYVTLEPCSTWGRTPPCVGAIVRAGVGRVVYAIEDPNPQNGGLARAALEAAGIRVEAGLLADEARALEPDYHRDAS